MNAQPERRLDAPFWFIPSLPSMDASAYAFYYYTMVNFSHWDRGYEQGRQRHKMPACRHSTLPHMTTDISPFTASAPVTFHLLLAAVSIFLSLRHANLPALLRVNTVPQDMNRVRGAANSLGGMTLSVMISSFLPRTVLLRFAISCYTTTFFSPYLTMPFLPLYPAIPSFSQPRCLTCMPHAMLPTFENSKNSKNTLTCGRSMFCNLCACPTWYEQTCTGT